MTRENPHFELPKPADYSPAMPLLARKTGGKQQQEETAGGLLECKESKDQFCLGPWRFTFEKNGYNGHSEKVKKVLQQSYGHLVKTMGEPSQVKKGDWKITIAPGGECHEIAEYRTLTIGIEASDSLIIHELAHMFQGQDFPEIDWLREGIPVALSNIIAAKLGIAPWSDPDENMPLGQNLENNLGMQPPYRYDMNLPSLSPRYFYSGQFWKEVLAKDPQAVSRLTANIRKLYASMKNFDDKVRIEQSIEKMSAEDILKQFLGYVPDNFARAKNLLNPKTKSHPEEIVYAYIVYEGEVLTFWISNVKKMPDGNELVGMGYHGRMSIINPAQPDRAYEVPFQGNEKGAAGLRFPKEYIIRALGKTPVYRAIIEIPGAKNEILDFTL